MALKRPKGPAGTLVVLEQTSKILKDNPLGDPHVRKLGVWLPPQYDHGGNKRFPVLYDLVGFTGSGLAHANWKPFGGYGAVLHGMKHARYWGAIADHSGDAYFDFVYWHDWPNTLNELAKHRAPKRKAGAYDVRRESGRKGLAEGLDDGRIKRFLAHVWKKEKLSTAEGHCIMNLCMAATYDPDPKAPLGFRVPFNLESGEVIEERWRKWREHDPINLVAKYRDNLTSLRGIYIDCGWRDQYHIHYGARILSKRLAEARIRHRCEEFDDDHSDIDYRMDVSLPFLYRALKP